MQTKKSFKTAGWCQVAIYVHPQLSHRSCLIGSSDRPSRGLPTRYIKYKTHEPLILYYIILHYIILESWELWAYINVFLHNPPEFTPLDCQIIFSQLIETLLYDEANVDANCWLINRVLYTALTIQSFICVLQSTTAH